MSAERDDIFRVLYNLVEVLMLTLNLSLLDSLLLLRLFEWDNERVNAEFLVLFDHAPLLLKAAKEYVPLTPTLKKIKTDKPLASKPVTGIMAYPKDICSACWCLCDTAPLRCGHLTCTNCLKISIMSTEFGSIPLSGCGCAIRYCDAESRLQPIILDIYKEKMLKSFRRYHAPLWICPNCGYKSLRVKSKWRDQRDESLINQFMKEANNSIFFSQSPSSRIENKFPNPHESLKNYNQSENKYLTNKSSPRSRTKSTVLNKDKISPKQSGKPLSMRRKMKAMRLAGNIYDDKVNISDKKKAIVEYNNITIPDSNKTNINYNTLNKLEKVSKIEKFSHNISNKNNELFNLKFTNNFTDDKINSENNSNISAQRVSYIMKTSENRLNEYLLYHSNFNEDVKNSSNENTLNISNISRKNDSINFIPTNIDNRNENNKQESTILRNLRSSHISRLYNLPDYVDEDFLNDSVTNDFNQCKDSTMVSILKNNEELSSDSTMVSILKNNEELSSDSTMVSILKNNEELSSDSNLINTDIIESSIKITNNKIEQNKPINNCKTTISQSSYQSSNKTFSCGGCKTLFCELCESTNHTPLTCQEYKQILPVLVASEAMIEVTTCPKCSLVFSSGGGCSRLICPQCDMAFCKNCLSSWSKEESNFLCLANQCSKISGYRDISILIKHLNKIIQPILGSLTSPSILILTYLAFKSPVMAKNISYKLHNKKTNIDDFPFQNSIEKDIVHTSFILIESVVNKRKLIAQASYTKLFELWHKIHKY